MCGDVWNGFFLGKAKKEDVPCRFCGKRDGEGHLFWECTFLPLQHVRELPEFASYMSLDRSKWPRCLLWHGWLPGPSGIRDPCASSFGDLAFGELERCLGAYPVDFSGSWTPPDHWDADDIALEILTFGLMVAGRISPHWEVLKWLVLVFICLLLKLLFDSLIWGTAEEYGDARLERCRAFLPVPGVMQTVQRAEFWGAIVAMQAYWPSHLGIDNLNVARSIGRLLDRDGLVQPLPLVKDGDLVALVQYMVRTRGRETVRVTKVKGAC